MRGARRIIAHPPERRATLVDRFLRRDARSDDEKTDSDPHGGVGRACHVVGCGGDVRRRSRQARFSRGPADRFAWRGACRGNRAPPRPVAAHGVARPRPKPVSVCAPTRSTRTDTRAECASRRSGVSASCGRSTRISVQIDWDRRELRRQNGDSYIAKSTVHDQGQRDPRR
jgi:hypothetical protein